MFIFFMPVWQLLIFSTKNERKKILHISKMSLGFQREQDRIVPKKPPLRPATKINDFLPKISENMTVESIPEKNVIQTEEKQPFLPEWLYTVLYTILILSTVSSLWVIASGMLWIKYYVECNQGMRICE